MQSTHGGDARSRLEMVLRAGAAYGPNADNRAKRATAPRSFTYRITITFYPLGPASAATGSRTWMFNISFDRHTGPQPNAPRSRANYYNNVPEDQWDKPMRAWVQLKQRLMETDLPNVASGQPTWSTDSYTEFLTLPNLAINLTSEEAIKFASYIMRVQQTMAEIFGQHDLDVALYRPTMQNPYEDHIIGKYVVKARPDGARS